MPATLIASEIVPHAPSRKQWTREECRILEAQGLVEPGRYELIEGDLVFKMKNRPHVLSLRLVAQALRTLFGDEFVNQEAPIDVSRGDNARNAPEPDIVVLRRPDLEIADGNPQPADVALAVEIADTSLSLDLSEKGALYARAGIEDYWVVDINARRVIVHREPSEQGYRSVAAYAIDESVSPIAKPAAGIPVRSMFPGK